MELKWFSFFTLFALFETGESRKRTRVPRNVAKSLSSKLNEWTYIESPNYPKKYKSNLRYEWTLIADPGHTININIEHIDIEHDHLCRYDYLAMYDGGDTSSNLIVKMCGSSLLERSFVSTGTTAMLQFITDDSDSASGFKLKFKSLHIAIPPCFFSYPHRHILMATNEKQTFESFGYPVYYPSDLREEWLIVKPNETAPLAIEVADSDIEFSSGCIYDKVTVYDGPCATINHAGLFCGTKKPKYNLDGSQFTLVRLYTDTSNHGRGVKITFYIGQTTDSDEGNVEGESEDFLKNILIATIASIAGVMILLAFAKCISKLVEKRRQRAKQMRRRQHLARVAYENRGSGSSVTQIQQIVSTRGLPPTSGRTVAISSISARTDVHFARDMLDGDDDGFNTIQPYSEFIVQPPPYHTIFTDHTNNPLQPIPVDNPTAKLPMYNEPSTAPPPYSGNRTAAASASVIQVQPNGHVNRDEIMSPPPRYEDT